MKIAVITPYATMDGIAIYAEDLFARVGQKAEVIVLCSRDFVFMSKRGSLNYLACWDKSGNSVDDVLAAIKEVTPDVVHLQSHDAYFQLHASENLINAILALGIKIVITAHNVRTAGHNLGEIAATLRRVDQIITLSAADHDYLTSLGINSVYQPHPYWQYKLVDQSEMRAKLGLDKSTPIIATHGLVNTNKGLIETAKTIALIKKEFPQVMWLALNAVHPGLEVSKTYAEELEAVIAELGISENIYWHKKFIDDNQLVAQMLSLADIGLLPYAESGESASGAIRKFVAANLPCVISNIKQLKEVADVFSVTDSVDPLALAARAIELFNDPAAQILQREKMQDLLLANSWEQATNQHLAIYESLMAA